MDDQVVQRVLQEGGRDFYQQQPSTSASSSSSPSILQSLPLHVVCFLFLGFVYFVPLSVTSIFARAELAKWVFFLEVVFSA